MQHEVVGTGVVIGFHAHFAGTNKSRFMPACHRGALRNISDLEPGMDGFAYSVLMTPATLISNGTKHLAITDDFTTRLRCSFGSPYTRDYDVPQPSSIYQRYPNGSRTLEFRKNAAIYGLSDGRISDWEGIKKHKVTRY